MRRNTYESFETHSFVPDFVEPFLPEFDPNSADVGEADRRARNWKSSHVGPLTPGTDVHKREVCRMFRETFNPYRPSVIEWPRLDEEARRRITSLPIWDIAVQTEGKARLHMANYARCIADRDMRSASALNAWEENRHKTVLANLASCYGIPLANEPPYKQPRDAQRAYMRTGYSECIDSFFAFGLFAMAIRSELVATFEPVVQDECRHILLFANWVAWHRATLPWWRRVFFELRVAAVWIQLGWERMGLARSIDGDGNETYQDNNFTVTGTKSVTAAEYSVRDLMRICLEENERHFSGYDSRLKRPSTMPSLVRLLVRLLRR
jgi:hypothetical protein